MLLTFLEDVVCIAFEGELVINGSGQSSGGSQWGQGRYWGGMSVWG